MKNLSLFISISLITIFSFVACGDDNDKSEYIIDGTWTIGDRILTTESEDAEHIAFVKTVNSNLKYEIDEQYTINKTYTFRVYPQGYISTKYTPKKDGLNTPTPQPVDYELKGDSLYITENNAVLKAYCNIGEKILITRYKVTEKELTPILEYAGIIIEVPENFVGEYSSYEMR